MRSLQHYTTIDGLFGIIDSKSFHASNILFMNDKSEFQYGLDLLMKEMNHTETKITIINSDKTKSKRQLSSKSAKEVSEFLKRSCISVLQDAYNTNKKSVDIYSVSFCKPVSKDEKKEGILSQWRTYGHRGGVFIELELPKLHRHAVQWFSEHSDIKHAFIEVSYGDRVGKSLKESIKILFLNSQDFILKTLHAFDPSTLKMNLDRLTDAEKSLLADLFQALVQVPPTIKHPSFREEKEVRLLVWHNRTKEPNHPLVGYKKNDQFILPYMPLFEGAKRSLPFKRIVLGPHPDQDRRRESVERFLSYKGYSIPVECSTIPVVTVG